MDLLANVRNVLVLPLTKLIGLSIKHSSLETDYSLRTGKMHVLKHLTTQKPTSAQS